LPIVIPKKPQSLIPYIYSTKELSSLLDASLSYQKKRSGFEPYMVRTLLLLLYGAGLRISEAINLTLADVNLPQSLLTIRETKFYKTRLVPTGAQLTKSLSQYVQQRQTSRYPSNLEAPFFVGRNGKAVKRCVFQGTFRRICKKAGVERTDAGRYHPRLHDLRHTFAVHRLTAWYKEGANVQKLLPVLSVYLGHARLSSTSIYLTMTPALLEEAGRLFQRYAFQEETHE
jgi:site-specific recombinase XerD